MIQVSSRMGKEHLAQSSEGIVESCFCFLSGDDIGSKLPYLVPNRY